MTLIFWKDSLRKGAVDKSMNIFSREPFHFLVQGLIKLKKTAFKNIDNFFHSKIPKNASKNGYNYRRLPQSGIFWQKSMNWV